MVMVMMMMMMMMMMIISHQALAFKAGRELSTPIR